MQVIPAVDVLDGRVVRLLRGRYDAVTRYADDAVQVALGFVTDGAELVHVVDLAAARRGGPDRGLRRRLAAAGVPYQVGGGIRDPAAAAAAVADGARRVVVGTAAVAGGRALADIVEEVGAQGIVVALDVEAGHARGSGWEDAGRPVDFVTGEALELGVRRFLVTGIERDGAMTGPDLALLGRVAALAPEAAIVASGGVGSLDDLSRLAATGVEAVVVGRALYEGRFTLSEALEAASAARRQGRP